MRKFSLLTVLMIFASVSFATVPTPVLIGPNDPVVGTWVAGEVFTIDPQTVPGVLR